MLDTLNEIARREHEYFLDLAQRLNEFESKQAENQTYAEIYAAYHDAFTHGHNALHHFKAAIESYKGGNLEPFRQIVGNRIPPQPSTRAGAFIICSTACTVLPSGMFRARWHYNARQILIRLGILVGTTPESEPFLAELQQICDLLITFEHLDPVDEEEGGGGGLLTGLLTFGAGAAAGAAGKQIYNAIKGNQ
jgi:hypothetical protein